MYQAYPGAMPIEMLSTRDFKNRYFNNFLLPVVARIRGKEWRPMHKKSNGNILTNGGRVLAVTGIGNNMQEALDKSYDLVSKIYWNNVYFRKDIGHDLMTLE